MEVNVNREDEVVYRNDDGREFYFSEKEATDLAVMLSNAAMSVRVKHQRERADARAAKKNKGRNV